MTQQRFGSSKSTGDKLDILAEYVTMYRRALGSRFKTLYFDGFAGTGQVPLTKEQGGLFGDNTGDSEVLVGSAIRASKVSPPFSRYVFVDKRNACLELLRDRLSTSPNFERMQFEVGDANEKALILCGKDWLSNKARGVFFLDPFGSQVEWSTIEAIANTRAIDLWYLFPAGVGVFRQIGKAGTVDPTHEASITRLFGTEEWKTAFLRPRESTTLFDAVEVSDEKVVTPESAARFMQKRLRSVFRGGVMDELIPLGKHAYPSYYLMFAWGNPSSATEKLARRLSKAALKAVERKHGRPIGY